MCGEKVNDNGPDIDNTSDEVTTYKKKKKKVETKEDEEGGMIAILGAYGKGDINDRPSDIPGTEHINVR